MYLLNIPHALFVEFIDYLGYRKKSDESSSHHKIMTINVGRFVQCKKDNQGRNVLRQEIAEPETFSGTPDACVSFTLHSYPQLLGEGQPGPCAGSDRITGYPIFPHISCDGPGQTDNTLFRGTVVGLTEAPKT